MQSYTSEPDDPSTETQTGQTHYISEKDLPLVCPLPSDSIWSAHPRVFLKLDEQGRAVCPYCGNTYVKQD